MTARSIKRGAKPRARAQSAGRKTKQISAFQRIFRAVPLSSGQWQTLFTTAILAVVAFGAIGAANYAGLPDMARAKFIHLASDTGFEVKRVEVTGVKRVDELKVYDIVLAEKDRAMPAVDIERIRRELMQYGWIKEARVMRRLPDTLVVEIVERQPAALWQNGEKLSLIDSRGVVLEEVEGDPPAGLVRLEGPRANARAVALNQLLGHAPALKPQVVSARWVGNRRWDLGFKTGETLALPEGLEESQEALLNFARMDGVSRLLGRDIIHFDMRDPDRAYLRRVPTTAPASETASGQGEG